MLAKWTRLNFLVIRSGKSASMLFHAVRERVSLAQDAESDKDRGLIAQFRALRCTWISFLLKKEVIGF